MAYVSIRDMRLRPRDVWEQLRREGEIVVTSNGRPIAVMASIEDDPEEVLRSLRTVRAQAALARIRSAAATSGASRMALGEIRAEIVAARREGPARA